jgi:putative ATPase
MRPLTLDEFIGQEHIIGPGRLLRRAIQIDQLSSLIFYGPPGTGKTTLARIIANTTKAQFLSINAVLAGVKDIRDAIKNAQDKLALYSKRTILFIDEVHRFNKAQQDALLPHVENGTIILVGATTENPYFEVNKALVSRSRIFQLKKLSEKELVEVADQTLSNRDRGYGKRNVTIHDDAMQHLVKVANGDARAVLNALELAVETTEPGKDDSITITRGVIEDSIQQRAVLYDKDGDAHYDTISAFIKSIRGSDPDAALYWMAKMLYAGEDPRFIFRRMIILASEDIGLADPKAITVVVSAAQAFDYIGLPEGRFPMAQACLYLATAPKSNSTLSFFDAISAVTEEREDGVPDHLKDSSRDKDGFGHGDGYLYPHAYRDHWIAQQYLPNILQGKTFYNPTEQGYEKKIKLEVTRRREAQIEAMVEEDESDVYGSGAIHKRSGQKMWEGRTSGTTGEQLAHIRNRLLDLVKPEKQSLVLDLHARTGLLTFEATRRVPEGSVWTMTHTAEAYETMKTLAQRFPPFKQPQVIQTSFKDCDKDIKKEAGREVAFDVIVGRNVLAHVKDKVLFINCVGECLKDTGRLVLAETVHSASSTISDFIKGNRSEFLEKFKIAEEALFSDAQNKMVNWSVDSLKKDLNKSDLLEIDVSEEIFTSVRRLSAADIEFWLRESGKGERNSLGNFLREVFSPEDFEEIRKTLHDQLDNTEVTWKGVVAFFSIKKKATKALRHKGKKQNQD